MSKTIRISEESAALLTQRAAAHGLSIQAWIEELAQEREPAGAAQFNQQDAQSAIARILEIQKRVKPDPEGWTVRDYLDYGLP